MPHFGMKVEARAAAPASHRREEAMRGYQQAAMLSYILL